MSWISPRVFNKNDFYGPDDLTRVYSNANFLKQSIFGSTLITPVYGHEDMPTVYAINTARTNINTMVSAYCSTGAIAQIPVVYDRIQKFDFNDANLLEQNMLVVKDLWDISQTYYQYSGEVIAGQDIISR